MRTKPETERKALYAFMGWSAQRDRHGAFKPKRLVTNTAKPTKKLVDLNFLLNSLQGIFRLLLLRESSTGHECESNCNDKQLKLQAAVKYSTSCASFYLEVQGYKFSNLANTAQTIRRQCRKNDNVNHTLCKEINITCSWFHPRCVLSAVFQQLDIVEHHKHHRHDSRHRCSVQRYYQQVGQISLKMQQKTDFHVAIYLCQVGWHNWLHCHFSSSQHYLQIEKNKFSSSMRLQLHLQVVLILVKGF